MPRRWLPDHVTQYRDRHGKARYRFRRKGYKTHHFKAQPGTEEFREELAAAKQAKVTAGSNAPLPFTYDALVTSFYRTAKWQEMRASSRKTYGSIIERFRAKNGSKDVRRVQIATIDALLSGMAETPAAANNLRKTLKRLHRHAIKLGWRTDNPVDATDGFKPGKGWHCWTEEEIARYEQYWPLGTKERLAFALLLYTALRRSDMVTIGRQHRQGDELVLKHQKNDSDTIIPIAPALAAALDAMPPSQMTYLQTEFGKPFTSNGFGNWFRDRCDKVGLTHCSSHGLRKAMSRRLAESGATVLEGRAITGHKTDKEFLHYAEKADKRTLARAGMGKVVANPIGERNGEP